LVLACRRSGIGTTTIYTCAATQKITAIPMMLPVMKLSEPRDNATQKITAIPMMLPVVKPMMLPVMNLRQPHKSVR